MDWQQVVLNGGPPCFHLCEDGSFCGRAKRWAGHNDMHQFVSLYDVMEPILSALQDVRSRIIKSEHWWMDSPNRGGFDLDAISNALRAASPSPADSAQREEGWRS